MKTNDELFRSLLIEYTELGSKLDRLRVFLADPNKNGPAVGAEHWGLLISQRKAMEAYAEALSQRITIVEREIRK